MTPFSFWGGLSNKTSVYNYSRLTHSDDVFGYISVANFIHMCRAEAQYFINAVTDKAGTNILFCLVTEIVLGFTERKSKSLPFITVA